MDAPGAAPSGGGAWRRAVDHTVLALNKMRDFPDGQVRHCLLRHCLDACKLAHLMRATPLGVGADCCQELSDHLRQAVMDIVGGDLTGQAWDQAILPIREGGLGIRDPVVNRPVSRLAALVGFQQLATQRVGVPARMVQGMAPDLPVVLGDVAATLGGWA